MSSLSEWARDFFQRPDVVKAVKQKAEDTAVIAKLEDQFSDDCGEHFNCDGVHREGPW